VAPHRPKQHRGARLQPRMAAVEGRSGGHNAVGPGNAALCAQTHCLQCCLHPCGWRMMQTVGHVGVLGVAGAHPARCPGAAFAAEPAEVWRVCRLQRAGHQARTSIKSTQESVVAATWRLHDQKSLAHAVDQWLLCAGSIVRHCSMWAVW